MRETIAVRREHGMYRVYKLVNDAWQLKRTFFTRHQANRYIKGFARNQNGVQPERRKIAAPQSIIKEKEVGDA